MFSQSGREAIHISSNQAWVLLFIAGGLEIVWASGLKYEAIPSFVVVAALIITFDLLIKVAKVLPIGTAYAVFAAIGTVGTVIVEAITSQSIHVAKIVVIVLLLGFIVGLKLTTEEERS